MHREQFREYQDLFLGNLVALHVTCNTDLTAIAGPIDLYQVQIDTTQSASGINTSLEFADGTSASVFKWSSLTGIGTREVTFMGRPYRITNNLYLTRPETDTHTIHLTILYRPV